MAHRIQGEIRGFGGAVAVGEGVLAGVLDPRGLYIDESVLFVVSIAELNFN